MAKVVKRFRPKFVKRLRDRPSGIAQTGAHGTSHRQNPPDIHRLGWAPRPFPRTGMTGQPNSSIMGAMGTGQLSYYTDEDREEYERQSGPPGKGGNYKSDMQRQYINKLKSRPVIGLPVGVIGESELREVIRNIISELNEDPMGRAAFNYEMLRSEDGDDDEDDEDADSSDDDDDHDADGDHGDDSHDDKNDVATTTMPRKQKDIANMILRNFKYV